jgi:integrase
MTSLVRQQKTYYVDRAGKRAPKSTPGAKKVREKSSLWYGQGVPGYPPKKRIPLATDKEAARRMLDDLVRKAERGQVGLPDRDAGRRSLSDYLVEFESDVALGLASKGGKKKRTPAPGQVRLIIQRVRDVLDGCGLAYPADLNSDAPAKVAKYLHARLRKPRNDGGFSAQTADFFLAAAQRFARWMAKRAAVPADLFDALPGFDPQQERTHARREVSPDELARVLDAAAANPRAVRTLTGADRYQLYLVAFGTGFRAGELSKLHPDHFHLDADPPAVSLPAKAAKNRKAMRFPLPPGIAFQLRPYLASKPAGKPVWPGGWHKHAAKMLRVDLAAAGVPYRVEGPNGPDYADFHALRHTFCSALAAAGTGAKELQTLARHSDPRLTFNLYTHARTEELAKAVGRLTIPTVAGAGENPLARLNRDELEGLTFGLLVALGGLLAPTGVAPQLALVDTPRDTPTPETVKDRSGQAGTVSRGWATA